LVKNVAVVMSGAAVAQMIGLGCAPVLSRLYGPAEFGILGGYLAVVVVLGAGATLNYADALMLPKADEQAAPLFNAAWLTTTVVAVGTGLGCWLVPIGWLSVVGIAGLGSVRWLLPFSVLALGLSQTFTAWCVRLQRFDKTSRSQILRSVSSCTAQVSSGWAGLGAGGLVGGSLAGDACTAGYLGRSALTRSGKLFVAGLHLREIWQAARGYREFALYGCPQNVLNALSQGVPVLALAHYHGVGVAGAYAFGMRVLQAPLTLMSNSFRQVLFQKLSQIAAANRDLYPPFLKSTTALTFLIFPPACLGFMAAPRFFAWVFGADWNEAGEYARWLIVWLAPMFCNVPAILTARVLRLQRNLFLFDVALLALRVATLVLGGLWLSSLHTIAALSIAGALFNVLLILYVAARLRRRSVAAGRN
jgi:O-antigen/teichoic acid export membrane protein